MRGPRLHVAVSAVLVLSACTPDGSAADSEPSPSVTATEPSRSPEQEALDAYRGMMAALVEGSHQGATDHPYLEIHAKGQALELTRDMLDGTKATGEPELAPEVVRVDLGAEPPVAEIEDCVDVSAWLVEGVDPEQDAIGQRRPFLATVTEGTVAWRVEELWLGDYGSC